MGFCGSHKRSTRIVMEADLVDDGQRLDEGDLFLAGFHVGDPALSHICIRDVQRRAENHEGDEVARTREEGGLLCLSEPLALSGRSRNGFVRSSAWRK